MNFNAFLDWFAQRSDYLGSHFMELTTGGLTLGAIYALIALGYTLVYGVLKLINFAHSEVFMVGAFASVMAWELFGLTGSTPAPSLGMLVVFLILGTAVAIAASGATALTLELVAYRPLRRKNAPRLVFLITAIGASLAISQAVGVLTGHNKWKVPNLVSPNVVINWDTGFMGTLRLTDLDIGIILAALLMLVVLDLFINRSRLGMGIRAVAQDPDTAALMGVNKNRVFMLTFLLGGVAAGLAAILYNLRIGNIQYDVGFLLGVKAFTAAVLGGIGNLRGALLGGFALGLVELWGAGFFGNQWLNVVAFVVLVIVLMFRPTGLLGESLGRSKA
ncbi:High-affinity branched-chain amino acid transport system permease protein LivH [Stackebrandtia soli]